MGLTKSAINQFTQSDIYSMLLFVLFQMKEIPEYAPLSELIYILDRKNFLKMCEYFGGTQIEVPTIQLLEDLLYALQVYNKVTDESVPVADAFKALKLSTIRTRGVRKIYRKLVKVLKDYEFTKRTDT